MNYKRCLRIIFSALVCVYWTGLHAQTTRLHGRVLNQNDRSAINGATIRVKNSPAYTLSDQQGNFDMAYGFKRGDSLEITSIGYAPQTIAVTGGQPLTVYMSVESGALTDVVVTALGIKKEKKKLGYAVQEVKGDALVKAREPNVLAGLTGKVAGLRIANSADFFGTPDIKLRGVTPLIVVDGVPLEGTTMWEISADDVDNYSILKGPAASALYGWRGVNGAIQITTKKGSKSHGPEFSFNSTTTFDLGTIQEPKLQNEYGTGYDGIYIQGDPTYEYWGAWGPKLDGRLLVQYNSPVNPDSTKKPLPWIARGADNLQHFLNTGILTTNNISVSAGNENGNFRASLTQLYQKGVVPNTRLGGMTFNMSGGLKLNKRLSLDADINYNKFYTPNYPSIGYGRASFIYGLVLWTGANVDVRDLRNYWVPGQEGLQQMNYDDAGDYNNPYFVAYEQTNGYYKDNIFGNVSLKYDVAKNLHITARTAINSNALYQPKVYPQSYNHIPQGNYSEDWYNMFESNSDVLIDYSKNLGDFEIKANVGASARNWSERNIYGSTDGLSVPGWDNFASSINPTTPTNYKNQLQEYGTYASADVSYKDLLFLGLTGRYDWSSTLPQAHSGYFYPSVSLSTILNEYIDLPKVISYAKLRAAVARVGAGMTPYSFTTAYIPGVRWNDNLTLGYPSTIISPNVKPSFSTGFETGGELRFLHNRVGLDLTYFNFVDGPQTYYQAISNTSAFTAVLTNGRKTIRKGYEVVADATPVSTRDLKWNVAINWSTYQQYLKALAPGETNEGLLHVGDRMDAIVGTDYMYAPDGQIIVGSDGLPQVDPINKKLGYYNDSWIGGITNNVSYKNLSLSFSFDARVGGQIISTYERYLWAGGRHLGISKSDRENWYAGGSYVVKGVKVVSGTLQRDGNGNVVSDTRKFATNDVKTDYFDYVQNTFGYWGIDRPAIVNRSYIKLREVVLTYHLPRTVLSRTFIKDASFSVVGRNLWLSTPSSVIDPDQFTGPSDNLQTPAFREMGFNLNVNF